MGTNYELNDIISAKAALYTKLSDEVWETPELGFQENLSAVAHIKMLEKEGFTIQSNLAGIPTAFCGEAGKGGPVIAVLGEFDALPGLSQVAGSSTQEPVKKGGNGHGCGHNMLGAGSLLAAVAIKDWLAATGTKGRVRYYGCPAEESGSGKSFMVGAGVFDDVDIAFCWHPSHFTGVNPPRSLACTEMEFTFLGRASHAASAPHLGRSALDAIELMHVGINYMREHMLSSSRVHYAILNAGGTAPNVVQAQATNRVMIRATTMTEMAQLVSRIRKIADGAAMMSETTVSDRVLACDTNLVGNEPLEQTMDAVIRRLGGPKFDDTDRAQAAKFQETLSEEDIADCYHRFEIKQLPDEVLHENPFPLGVGKNASVGSTDVGTVSWVVPTVQCRVATYAIGTPGHSWQLVAQGKLPAAHKGLIHAARIIAETAADLFQDEALCERVISEHLKFVEKYDFTSLFANGAKLNETLSANKFQAEG